MIDRIWKRLAEKCLPSGELRDLVHVAFVPVEYDEWRNCGGGVLRSSAGAIGPGFIFAPITEWPGFRRWPNLLEMMPVFRIPRGRIRFIQPPSISEKGAQ